jgi:hypothetical protein
MAEVPRSHHGTSAWLEPAVIGCAVMILVAALSLARRFAPGAFHDDGVYLALGQSIATGHGYHSIYQVGSPVHAKYPPALPLLFSLLWRLAGTLRGVASLAFAADVVCAGALAALLVAIARVRLGLSRPLAVCFGVGPLLLVPAITYLTLPISEPYFMLLWAASLLLVDRSDDTESAASSPFDFMLCAALCAACLFRTQSVVLVPAFLLALHKRGVAPRRIAIIAGTAALPTLAWYLWHAHMLATGAVNRAPDEMPYLEWVHVGGAAQLAFLLARTIAGNARDYLWLLIHLLGQPTNVAVIVFVLLAAAFCTGFRRVARIQPALAYSVVAVGATVLVWPFAQDRLLLSLLPFASLIAGVGWAQAERRFTLPAYALLLLIVISVGWRQATLRRETLDGMRTGVKPSSFVPDYALLYNSRFIHNASSWLLENTAPSARVLVDFPAAIYLNSGRHTLAANPTESEYASTHVFARQGAYLRERVERDSMDVVIVAGPRQGMRRDVATVLRRCPGALVRQTVRGEAPLPSIFRINRSVLLAAGDRCLGPDSQ